MTFQGVHEIELKKAVDRQGGTPKTKKEEKAIVKSLFEIPSKRAVAPRRSHVFLDSCLGSQRSGEGEIGKERERETSDHLDSNPRKLKELNGPGSWQPVKVR